MKSLSKRILARVTSLIMCAVFLLELASCGTLLYPERRGQKSGQIDVAVILMDGIGLFFFIIPGVLAFAVDFSTGAIYLPPGQGKSRKASSDPADGMRVVRMNPDKMDHDTIVRYVEAYTGHRVRLDDEALITIKAEEDASIARELARLGAFRKAI